MESSEQRLFDGMQGTPPAGVKELRALLRASLPPTAELLAPGSART
jgi:hypothetical protein